MRNRGGTNSTVAPLTERNLAAIQKSLGGNDAIRRVCESLRLEWARSEKLVAEVEAAQLASVDAVRRVLVSVDQIGLVNVWADEGIVVKMLSYQDEEGIGLPDENKIPHFYRGMPWRRSALSNWRTRPNMTPKQMMEYLLRWAADEVAIESYLTEKARPF